MFDQTRRTEEGWRITANPLAWGNTLPEIVVLGFSKGPTQAGALAMADHDEIAFKRGRRNVGKILAHVGLLQPAPPDELSATVDRLIADRNGRFHFGSLVRCTVERFDAGKGGWAGSGGGMLDRFVATAFGREVTLNCTRRFLGDLPPTVKLIVMFGLGSRNNYVRAAQEILKISRPGRWRSINDVAYRDDQVTVVHVEHFAAQGALIPNWLGENAHPRAKLGLLAREAVAASVAGGPV